MVEIVEEPNGNEAGSSSRPVYTSISQYVSVNTMNCVLFGSRVLTLFFALNYMLPMIGIVHWHSAYYKVFAASAATFALRLHTRVRGSFSLSAQFLQILVVEDAFHYLIYSVIFLTTAPVTMAILPVSVYALLHSASFLGKALRETGHITAFASKIEQFAGNQTRNALGIIACSEIFLVPLLVSLIFSGQASLFVPFVYYRFLSLRYASRRNPSTREAFFQMRMSLQNVASSQNCPNMVRSFIYKAISFISDRAPPVI